MTQRRTVKKTPRRPTATAAIVVVIASPADLRFAAAMRQPPDLFELRLDCLVDVLNQVEKKLSILSARGRTRRGEPAPIIITARHPREGGANNLSVDQRRQLLLRFLPHAKYIDVELRSARALRPVLVAAQKRKVRRIISFHDFKRTPSTRSLHAKLRQAKAAGADVFKVATRTDTAADLARLFQFIAQRDVDLAVSAMGIGKLGAISRIVLARCGSALIYAHLGSQRLAGQPSLSEVRRWALGVGR